MELNYRYRAKLLDIVKKSRRDLMDEINNINDKFKAKDSTMINEKRAYWMQQQEEAYDRLMTMDAIIYQINESL